MHESQACLFAVRKSYCAGVDTWLAGQDMGPARTITSLAAVGLAALNQTGREGTIAPFPVFVCANREAYRRVTPCLAGSR